MSRLITKAAHAAIDCKGFFEYRQFQREIMLQGRAGKIRLFADYILCGVTLKKNRQRLVFRQGRERLHADIGQLFESWFADDLNVPLARTVTRLAIDSEALIVRVVI